MPSSPGPALRRFIGAVHDEWRMFSDNPDDYEIGPPIGFGATSIVYSAHYMSKDESPPYPCAVKVINLDKLPQQTLRLLRRETQLMSLSKHPNVLRVRGSWITGHNLYIALRLMNAGSAADVMHYGWPGGMEEEVVKCVLRQALEGLNYLHINGFIHRDVKAANLLIDDDGTVLLGDLGVAASLSDEESFSPPLSSHQRTNSGRSSSGENARPPVKAPPRLKLGKRKSFVGTPCWMAPEVISGKQYDAKADIWSFGITAIELTQGRAPRSREAPARVLLKTVQDASPEFARESSQYKFSKAFKEIVESCLTKDPARRPTAAELLETSFFKSAKRKQSLVNTILRDLPPLIHRQERRPKPSASTNPTRNSMSSWDFTIDIPHSPSHNSAHPTYFSTIHRPTRLGSLEEDRNGDASEQAEATHPIIAPTNANASVHDSDADTDWEREDDSHSSVEGSVFDLEVERDVSNPTTPEISATPMLGLSVSPTPLSCSPAAALDIPVQPGKSADILGTGRNVIAPAQMATASVHDKTTPNNQPDTLVRKKSAEAQQPPLSHRRGSSPTADRENVSSLLALKRIASASPRSTSKVSSISADIPELKETVPIPTPTTKESRWRKLVRGGSSVGTEAREDESRSSGRPASLKDSRDRRRSTLGRILERSGK